MFLFLIKNGNSYFISPFWKRETRVDALNPQRVKKEEHISIKWKQNL